MSQTTEYDKPAHCYIELYMANLCTNNGIDKLQTVCHFYPKFSIYSH